MKRTERHHLKENDLAQSIIAARHAIEARKRQVTTAVIVLLVVGVAAAGYMTWRQRTESEAERLLGDAMTILNARVIPATPTSTQPGEVPAAATFGAVGSFSTEAAKLNAALPKLKTASDAHPDTDAGITARYHYASALSALGRHQEAIAVFDEVVERAGDDSLYGRMSRLGKADAQRQAGQLDAAIATWTELAASADEGLPKDAILMELAKAYVAKGNQEEARKAFNRLVDEHPTSPYSAEARAELGS